MHMAHPATGKLLQQEEKIPEEATEVTNNKHHAPKAECKIAMSPAEEEAHLLQQLHKEDTC